MSAIRVDAKVVMLGKESVGKTSLVERYVHHRFLVGPYQNTIGAAFVAKPIQLGEKVVTLGIWDTAGSERYEAMSRIYYRGARAAIVCYDLTDSSSFQRARFWVKELQNCEEQCKIYLCGTKNDLITADRSLRQIDYHDAQDFAEEIGAQYFETSSKTGNNMSCSTKLLRTTTMLPSSLCQRKMASTWARRKTHISTPVATTTDAERQDGTAGHMTSSRTWMLLDGCQTNHLWIYNPRKCQSCTLDALPDMFISFVP
ncbi:ras-related protein Rab-24 isoform X2 [Takifugu flavidus]|uniref:ras-related protein Rab-24 isoform X2 n=1 Tax=Takifugu flavidus TaxID=433684 RepID=UPI0025442AD8|nr:ras-related protein Rab-24 isoform X2 [Takifugu flavidus]